MKKVFSSFVFACLACLTGFAGTLNLVNITTTNQATPYLPVSGMDFGSTAIMNGQMPVMITSTTVTIVLETSASAEEAKEMISAVSVEFLGGVVKTLPAFTASGTNFSASATSTTPWQMIAGGSEAIWINGSANSLAQNYPGTNVHSEVTILGTDSAGNPANATFSSNKTYLVSPLSAMKVAAAVDMVLLPNHPIENAVIGSFTVTNNGPTQMPITMFNGKVKGSIGGSMPICLSNIKAYDGQGNFVADMDVNHPSPNEFSVPLTLNLASGQSSIIELRGDIPTMQIGDSFYIEAIFSGDFTNSTWGVNSSYVESPFTNGQHFKIFNSQPTGIIGEINDKFSVIATGEAITLSDQQSFEATIFSLDGREVAKNKGEKITFNLPVGTYAFMAGSHRGTFAIIE